MKKNFIAIIALLVTGIISAQSKSDLQKEFERLEKKMEEITLKYDAKLAKLDSNNAEQTPQKGIKDMPDDFGNDDFKGDLFGEKTSTKDKMKMFVEMYESDAKEGNNMSDFFSEMSNEKQSAKDKEYFKLVKEFETKRAEIDKKMYEIAKKYLSKK